MNILLAPWKRSSYLYLSAKIVTLAPFPKLVRDYHVTLWTNQLSGGKTYLMVMQNAGTDCGNGY